MNWPPPLTVYEHLLLYTHRFQVYKSKWTYTVSGRGQYMKVNVYILWAVFNHILIYTFAILKGQSIKEFRRGNIFVKWWVRKQCLKIRKFTKKIIYQFTLLLISVIAFLVRLSLVRTLSLGLSLVRNIICRVFVSVGVRNCLATTVFNRRNVQLINEIHEFSISFNVSLDYGWTLKHVSFHWNLASIDVHNVNFIVNGVTVMAESVYQSTWWYTDISIWKYMVICRHKYMKVFDRTRLLIPCHTLFLYGKKSKTVYPYTCGFVRKYSYTFIYFFVDFFSLGVPIQFLNCNFDFLNGWVSK